jgi:hypothetical protein
MINVVYKKGQLTTHMNLHPKVLGQVTKYMLKQGVDSLLVEGRAVSIKGTRVYLDGILTTWSAFEKEFVK